MSKKKKMYFVVQQVNGIQVKNKKIRVRKTVIHYTPHL